MNTRLLRSLDKWRARFNPLRGLTVQRAVTLLEAGESGMYADLQWAYRMIEKREPTLRGLKRLRLGALAKLDWDIRTKDDSPEALRQARILRAVYDGIANLNEAIRHLALAEFRGYAHLEKVYAADDPAAAIVRLEPVPQWHWVRDGLYGAWEYNATAAQVMSGTAIDTRHFVIREVDDPVNEIAFIVYLRKSLSQKDWDAFVEIYGIPPLFATLPANVPPDKESEYLALAEAVVGDMRGVLPNGAAVTTVDAGSRGANPFRDHLSYQDEQLVLAGTSGKLAMLTASTGMNSGQADAHEAVFDKLAAAEAAEIAEVFQRAIDAPALAKAAPGQPVLAWFAFDTEDEESAASLLDNAVKAKNAGFTADAAQLSEKTGMKLTAAAPVAPHSPAAPAPSEEVKPKKEEVRGDAPDTKNRSENGHHAPPQEAASHFSLPTSSLLTALAEQAAPILDLVESLPDPAADPAGYRQKLGELRERLPELLDSTPVAAALEAAMLHAAALPTTKNRAEQEDEEEAPDAAYLSVMNRNYHDKRDKLGRFVAAGGFLSPADNIRAGADAIAIARRRGGQDVNDAMSRRGLGRIHFKWGRPGGKHMKSGSATHVDGYGLSHIEVKHGPEALKALPEVIAKGDITHAPDGNPLKRIVTLGKWRATLHADIPLTSAQRAAIKDWEKARRAGRAAGPFPVARGHKAKDVYALTAFDATA